MSKKNDLRLQTLQLGRANTQKDISDQRTQLGNVHLGTRFVVRSENV